MGAVSFSLDPSLVDALQSELPLSIMVETGTFEAANIKNLVNKFTKFYSVELSSKHYAAASSRFRADERINLLHGDSTAILPKLITSLNAESVLYFLDAHWCSDIGEQGDVSSCPLLGELRAFQHLNSQSVIIIDDARLFCAPPPAPHEISTWPSLSEVLSELSRISSSHELMILNDTFVYYPRSIQTRSGLKMEPRGALTWLSMR